MSAEILILRNGSSINFIVSALEKIKGLEVDNIIQFDQLSELPSISELQDLIRSNGDQFEVGINLSDRYYSRVIGLAPEAETELFNKHYYLDYSKKRKKGKSKRY